MSDEFKVTEKFIKLIFEIKTSFEDKSIKYWLDEGTLLGVVRDGDLIEGDHDFDFSVEFADISNIIEICEILKNKGYNVKYQGGLPYVEDMIQVYLQDDYEMKNIHVDINIYYIANGKAIRRDLNYPVGKYGKSLVFVAKILFREQINYRKSNNLKKMFLLSLIPFRFRKILSYLCMDIYIKFGTSLWQVVPKKYFDNFKEIELFDSVFLIPTDCENYLSYRYGVDWRTPNHNWVWRESPDQAIEYNKLNALNIAHKCK